MDFPHPSTGDQFFNDEQFDIMRSLGEWTALNALTEIKKKFETKLSDKKMEWAGDSEVVSQLNRHLKFINTWIDFNADQPLKVASAPAPRKYDLTELLKAYIEL